MTRNAIVLFSVLFSLGTAMADDGPSTDCRTVKECLCQEACYDVCRVVNGVKVCEESCKTICEPSWAQ